MSIDVVEHLDGERLRGAGGSAVVSRETPPSLSLGGVLTAADLAADPLPPHRESTPIAVEAATAVLVQGRLRRGLPRPDRTRVIVVANQKGGVGKTTTTVNLAAALAAHGLRVLAVDLDPQGNATTALGSRRGPEDPSVYDALIDEHPVSDLVQPVPDFDTLWCLPAALPLAGAEIELVALPQRESRLRQALAAHLAARSGQDRYDYVFVDCPPSLGLLTLNALVAADEVLIPIQCEYYALEGVTQLLHTIGLVTSHLNPGLTVSTVLLTMYDGRTRLASQVADEVREHFAAEVLRTVIPRSVRISEAPSFGQTVMTYDAGSAGAMSYLEAARELAVRGTETQ